MGHRNAIWDADHKMAISPCGRSLGTVVAGSPCTIRTTRKAGGLLWPCKGLLPAAPKDAGFHAVQAQCPCRLGYPLKGS